MTAPSIGRPQWTASRRAGGRPVLFLFLAVVALAGCTFIRTARRVIGQLSHDRMTMAAFTDRLRSAPGAFEVTYVTSGSAPATVVYAVRPPDGLLFKVSGTGDNLDVIVNPSGEYSCALPPSVAQPSRCTKLGKASMAGYRQLLGFYTPAHWVSFLHGLALVAGLVGEKVTSSTMTVNGFPLSCLDLAAPKQGTSVLCATRQNILGYVKVAADSTSFEIERYSRSPSPSLFRLPPGATVTTLPAATPPATS